MSARRSFAVACLGVFVAALCGGCARVMLVHDVSSTPDGRRVDVVGSVYQKEFLAGTSAISPRRWVCLRDAGGHLHCRMDASALPLRE